jgi:3',5'-cyclic AMP phosphodiesterase CpdA
MNKADTEYANAMPIPRRTFTQMSLACALKRSTSWANPANAPLSLLVVSDTHLGMKNSNHAADQWLKLAAEMRDVQADMVLHLGDIVDGGREDQYAPYLKGRELIGKPMHEIPGNHDPAQLFSKHIRAQIDAAVDLGHIRILLLNNSRTDSHDGFLSVEQLQWIRAQCTSAREQHLGVILAMHVPARTNISPDRGWHIKPQNGQRELYQIIKEHQERVIALFHGHFHNGLRGWHNDKDAPEISFPSALYNQDRNLEASGAPGFNPSEFRPAFSRVTIHPTSLEISLHVLRHGEVLSKKLARG